MVEKHVLVAGAALAIGIVAACNRSAESTPAATTTTTGARLVTRDEAAKRLASARCDREIVCNNVGQGRRWADRDACLRELGHDARSDVRADACPHGLSVPGLEDCLSDVRHERCGNPLDTMDRIATCRRGNLCVED